MGSDVSEVEMFPLMMWQWASMCSVFSSTRLGTK